MPNDKKTREQIIKFAMQCAAEQGWNDTTLQDIGQKAGLNIADIHDQFDDKTDILCGFGRMIDRQILSEHSAAANEQPREVLFDLLMDRFDALNDYRAGVHAVMSSFKFDPKQGLFCVPHLCKSMSWMLETAGISTSGLKGAAHVAGLTALYLKTAKVWMNDDSQDLSKVMSELDKNLTKAETWALRLGF